MFLHKNKKEAEYNKARSISRKEEGVKVLKSIYKFFYYLLVISFFFVLIHSLIFSPLLGVDNVEIIGTENLKKEDVALVAKNIYSEKYLRFIPKKNLLIFPVKNIESELKESFRRIKNVDINKHFPNKVTISIKERRSMLILCNIQSKCYIIDEDGFVYEQLELDSKNAIENKLVKIISNEKDREIIIGERILNSERTSFFLDSSDRFFKKSEVELTGEIYISSRMAEEAIFKSIEGWDIYVSTTFPLEKGAEMLKLFLDKGFISENERKNLEYIDLRIENRTYYKFKNEEKIGDDVEGE